MEAVGAAASIVGIVSFGVGLAKSLQALTDTIIDAEETITTITADVSNTTSTLRRLQDFIDQDNTALREEQRSSLLTERGIKEIGDLALSCQKIYVQIIVLVEKASGQNDENGSPKGQTGPQVNITVEDMSVSKAHLEAFSNKVTKLGRGIRWAWLEPRIQRCQEHLGRVKLSLMLSLQVFQIAGSRAHPSAMHVLGADDEHEMIARAERLRRKVIGSQANTRRPSADNSSGTRSIIEDESVQSSVSHSVISSQGSPSIDRERASGSLSFNPFRSVKAAVVYCRRKTERKSHFSSDLTSAIYEAYLISGSPFDLPGQPIKLAFGHRRLVKQIKRTLRKCNPWDIYLALSPHHQVLVDGLVQQVCFTAAENTSVCLVAIELDGHDTISDITASKVDDLTWTRMVVFFCYEQACTRNEDNSSPGLDASGTRSLLRAMFKHLSTGRNQRRKELLNRLATQKAEEERREKERADREAEKLNFENDKMALGAKTKELEADRASLERRKKSVEIKQQALKDTEERFLKVLAESTPDEELKKTILEEYAKIQVEGKIVEEGKKAAEEQSKESGEDQLPIKFKDAVGRKYSFPFRLARKWKKMEGLINQAFFHIENFNSHVREGHYDLEGPEGELILKETWDTTIQPGWQVTMKMWPETRSAWNRRGMHEQAALYGRGGGVVRPPPGPVRFGGPGASMPMSADLEVMPGFGRKGKQSKKKSSGWGSLFGQPPKSSSKRKKAAQQQQAVSRPVGGASNGDDDSADIDKELGLDALKMTEQLALKDIDELLKDWTTAGNGERDQDSASSWSLRSLAD